MIDKYINRINEIQSDFNRKILEEVQKIEESEQEEVFTYLVMGLSSKLMLILARDDIQNGSKKNSLDKLDRLLVGLRVLIKSDIEELFNIFEHHNVGDDLNFYSGEESKTVH